MSRLRWLLLLLVLSAPALPPVRAAWRFNRAAVQTLAVLVGESGEAATAYAALAAADSGDCRAAWYRGFLDQAAGQNDPANNAWAAAIRCDRAFIPLLRARLPDSRAWAAYAVEAQPQAAAGWFWLAEFYTVEQPGRAIELLRTGLALDPTDGRAWNALGDLLAQSDPEAAIEAYLQACFNGDPGWNGCWKAGQTAERLGDYARAVEYYRYSRWPVARQRAELLEGR